MRIGIAGIAHESNTFIGQPTTLERFSEGSLLTGEAIVQKYQLAHHEIGGYLEGASRHGFKPVPLMYAAAMPLGPLTRETFEALLGQMLDAIKNAVQLDGLLLAQHGAMVAEGYPDADGEVLSRVRQVVGPKLPVIVTHDCHANVSQKVVEDCTALIIYRSNPHLDQRERGLEAARLIARTVRGEVRPVQALETPPLVINILKQYTGVGPCRSLMQNAESLTKQPDILSASVSLGFPYADVPKMGASFLVVADGNQELARQKARWMAQRAWEGRQDFIGQAPSPPEAIKDAMRSDRFPVTLLDVGDNVGGGSAADSTILLEEAYKQGARGMMIILKDPQAARECVKAGVSAQISLKVGAKTDNMHGRPVPIRGVVRTLSDGKFIEEQPRHGGSRFNDQGITAVVETPEEHTIVLTSLPMPPFSLEQVLSLGIKPERKKTLVAKGVVLPRPAYEPVSARMILVNTPGSTSADLSTFIYKSRRRPLFPFEMDAKYTG